MLELLFTATIETLEMVFLSLIIGVFFALPIASLLFSTKHLKPNVLVNRLVGMIINCVRSIPYIILVVALIPVTRFLVGTSIGTLAASVPLGVAAIAVITRIIEESFAIVPREVIEMAISIKATKLQIIRKVLIPESLPNIISGLTLVVINLVCYSAMAGMVGGGGLGDLAIRYGYQRYNLTIMIEVILILVSIVQLMQFTGNFCVNRMRK